MPSSLTCQWKARVLAPLLALAGWPNLAAGQSGTGPGGGAGHVEVRVEAASDRVAPGGSAVVAVVLDHEPGWHSHTHEPKLPPAWEETGFFAIPTTIDVNAPEGVRIAGIQWPAEHFVEVDLTGSGVPELYGVYAEEAVAYVVLRTPEQGAGPLTVVLEVGYQACDDSVCDRPQSETHEVTFTLDPEAGSEPPLGPALFAGFDRSRLAAGEDDSGSAAADRASATPPALPPESVPTGFLGLAALTLWAALGGLVLNLTPCVLPVIPIKVMTLVKHGGESRSRTLALGAWMALGVVAFWVAVGLPMAFLNSALDPSRLIFGHWWVTLGLGLIIALLGVGIMGMFTINLPQSVYKVNPKADTAHGSFLFGVMTAVLGLPCFGFVAGGLLVGAATMPPVQIMAVFGGLGVGMAAPYLVLAAYPRLVDRIPRTGPASELVKQVMGLLMLAAAAFFVSVGVYTLIVEQPWMATSMKWWSAVAFVALAALWLVYRTFQISRRPGVRLVFSALAVVVTGAFGWFAASSTVQSKVDYLARAQAVETSDYVLGAWNHYTPERFKKAIDDGKVVVIDFTAEWCLNCKAYKRGVLDQEPVRSRLQRGDVVAFEADVTSRTDPANDLMEDLGVTGIPLLAIFGPGLEAPLLSNQATGGEVVQRIDQAAARSGEPG